MLPAILLVSIVSLFAIAEVSAQTTTTSGEGFSGLAGGRTVIIVDDSGVETPGRLLRLTPDELTLSTGGRERSFPRQHVAAIFERGDSLKNGAVAGVLTGAALGFAAGTQGTCGDFWTGLHSCSVSEKVAHGAFGALVFGALGAAIGVGIDALIPGRTMLYERPQAPSSPSFTIAPALSRSRGSVGVGVSW